MINPVLLYAVAAFALGLVVTLLAGVAILPAIGAGLLVELLAVSVLFTMIFGLPARDDREADR